MTEHRHNKGSLSKLDGWEVLTKMLELQETEMKEKLLKKNFYGESDEEIEFVEGRDPYRNLKKVRDIDKKIK